MAPHRPPTIIAMGGGGFSMEPDNPRLDEYVLAAAGVDAPRVLFLPTASADPHGYAARFHAAFDALGARTEDAALPLTAQGGAHDHAREGVHRRLRAADVVYVGGGNTLRMLRVWAAYGLPDLLRDLWSGGTVLAGVSAGALCWFESGVTDSIPGRMTPLACLGLLPGSFCPHYDGEAERRPAYESLVRAGALPAGFGVDDGCALHFEGLERVAVVASRPHAAAYRVERRDGDARESRCAARVLGGADAAGARGPAEGTV